MKDWFGFNWFTLAIVVIIAYFGYIGWQQQINLNKIEEERLNVELRYNEVKEKNAALATEKESLSEPENIEKIAREELGLVKPGEMPYIPVKKESKE